MSIENIYSQNTRLDLKSLTSGAAIKTDGLGESFAFMDSFINNLQSLNAEQNANERKEEVTVVRENDNNTDEVDNTKETDEGDETQAVNDNKDNEDKPKENASENNRVITKEELKELAKANKDMMALLAFLQKQDGTPDMEQLKLFMKNLKDKNVSLESLVQKLTSGKLEGFKAEDISEKKGILEVLPKKDKQDLLSFLDQLLQGLPAKEKTAFLDKVRKLETKLEVKAENIKDDEIDTSPLIATGLSPVDLQKLTQEILTKLEALEGKKGEGEKVVFKAEVKILPDVKEEISPQNAHDAFALLLENANPSSMSGRPRTVGEMIAARLNELTVGEGSKGEKPDFATFLKVLETAQNANLNKQTGPINALGTPQKAAQTPAAPAAPLNSILTGGGFFSSDTLSELTITTPATETGDSTVKAMQVPNLTLNQAQNSNLITQATQAGQPHPATKMLAARITRMAQQGETQRLTLKLEPPEMGRVEVRMEFTENKGVKTHMLIEKQETFLMLQRDAHILERALQQAGLDADGQSLSFELAAENHDFNDNLGHHDGNASSGSDGQSDNEVEIIETTMDWYVDPETGLTRYDILV